MVKLFFVFVFSGGSTGEDRKGKAKDQEKDAYVTQYQIVCPLWH